MVCCFWLGQPAKILVFFGIPPAAHRIYIYEVFAGNPPHFPLDLPIALFSMGGEKSAIKSQFFAG
jgi:hypothetical protein